MGQTPERRLYERWNVKLEAALEAGTGRIGCSVADLSLGGALLVTEAPLTIGMGFSLWFRLPNGMPLSASGCVVRASQISNSKAQTGYGVQFHSLDDVTRGCLLDYFSRPKGEVLHENSRIEPKYFLETDRRERLCVSLIGVLTKQDCERVRIDVQAQIQDLKGRKLRLCINGSRFECVAPDAQDGIRLWFAGLKRYQSLVGALSGRKSIGMLQLRRAVRDAQMADVFASFESLPEALDFLEAT